MKETFSQRSATPRRLIVTAILLLTLGLATAASGQPSRCGCTGEPKSLRTALHDDATKAVVLAYVLRAEGSSRVHSAASGDPQPDPNAHPYPWLHYSLVVERSWKSEVRSLWVERPWGSCGSVLWPGRQYLFTVSNRADPEATVMAGEPATTLNACASLTEAATATDLIESLGKPVLQRDLSAALQQDGATSLRAALHARPQCEPAAVGQPTFQVKPAEAEMVPGSVTELEVSSKFFNQTWALIQQGGSSNGRDQVILFAQNPTPCWFQLVPQIKQRWASTGSVRRIADTYAGLTFAKGWLPPYWNGTISLGKQPWIRKASWHLSSSATGPSMRPKRSDGVESSRTLGVLSLEPLPGSYLNETTALTAELRWSGKAPGPDGITLQPMFEARDGRLVWASDDPATATIKITSDSLTARFQSSLSKLFSEYQFTGPLQLRFVAIEGSSADSLDSSQIIDSTPPMEYFRGTEPPREPIPPPKEGVWYTGGNGNDCNQAIAINGARSTQQGIHAERLWWRSHHQGASQASQSLIGPNNEGGKVYDLITLTLEDGTEKELCFDITGFFGGPAR